MNPRWKSFFAAAALCSSLWGCSADDAINNVKTNALQTAVDTLITELTADGGVAQVVGAAGGTVEDSESGAAIEIPAGALPEADEGDALVVSIVPYAGAALEAPGGFAAAGDLIEINIRSVLAGENVQPISPVRISVSYSESVEAEDTARLTIGNFHSSAWVTQAAETVDTDALRVTASFATLSPFGALLGDVANAAPVGDDQSLSVDEDAVLAGTLTGTDADGDSLTFALEPGADVQHGTLTLQSDGSFEYTPSADYNGSDQFSFRANDGTEDSAVATVSITVDAVNDAPVAYAKSVTVNEDTLLSSSVSGSDVDEDALTFTLAPSGDVQHGTLTLQGNGSFEYTPSADYNGNDQFSFQVSDGTVYSAAATVSITVTPVNDAPTLSALQVTTPANSPVSGTLVGQDAEGSAVTYAVTTQPSHGAVELTAGTGAFTYTPGTNYTGSDTFQVQASDGAATSVPVMVTVTVVAPVRRYVRPSAVGAADGSSWADATANLQTAVNEVSAAGGGEVFIAAGTYRTTGTGALLTMAAGVDVYGGFAGTEAWPSERGVVDPGATVLSGDTDSSGTLTAGDANRVVVGATARLDGVTITGGNAVEMGYTAGAGIYNMAGKPLTLSNVHITGNHANADGGAIYNYYGILILENARISDNTSNSSGAGIWTYFGTVTMQNSAVVANAVNAGAGGGGGLYIMYSTLDFRHGLIDGNTASQNGGGIYLSNAQATVANSQISDNSATAWRGGGIYSSGGSELAVTHTQFVGNSAGSAGAGIAAMSSPALTVRNSSFQGNTAPSVKDVLNPPANAIFNTCSEDNLTGNGTNNNTITTNPFDTQAASAEYFFDPAHACADHGDGATATALFDTTGTAWENWSSEISGEVVEGSTAGVAAGMLHHPEDVWIRTFDVTIDTITWLTNASAATCHITNDADSTVIVLGAAELPSGAQGHALTSGTTVTMTCLSHRSHVKVAVGTVP